MERHHDIPHAAHLTIRSETEISEAIRECATLCMEQADPRHCIQEFVSNLLESGWASGDARQVHVGTLYVIAYLTGDDQYLPPRR